MKKLIVCRGLPGSGKSTWAAEYCNNNDGFLRINRDEIRAHLRATGWVWSQVAERRDVVPERDRLIKQALRSGWSVISDDTNLTGGHLEALALIASLENAEFEICSFLDVPLDECIRRDAVRAQPVGELAIRRMAELVGR